MKITQTHWDKAATDLARTPWVDVANKAIEIAEAEAKAQPAVVKIANEAIASAIAEAEVEAYSDESITAAQARALGAGNAEWKYRTDRGWTICDACCCYNEKGFKYRAVAQPEQAKPDLHAGWKAMYAQQVKDGTWLNHVWAFCDFNGNWIDEYHKFDGSGSGFCWLPHKKYRCTPKPTCKVRLLPDGKVKTMTREAAEKLQAETPLHDWFFDASANFPASLPISFVGLEVYAYRLKADLVKLDGELMTRKAAIAKCEAVKDTKELWYLDRDGIWTMWLCPSVAGFSAVQEYQLRPKALKSVSLKDMPVGVAVKPKSDGRIWKFIGTTNMQHNVCVLDGVFLRHELPADIELAPADQQPWIAVQDEKDYGLDKVPGLVYLWRSNHSYRIVGLVDDTWEMI